ncbi:MAG TPA: GAF and ANTAR domain-containing protein [Jatrophihabitans sp.]|nr:GAF and ANTAR domain-containing protein [Jatrophihabitans sp.]
MDRLQESELFARVVRELAAPGELQPTLDLICERARQLTGCDAAAVWSTSPGGNLTLQAVTDEGLGRALAIVLRGGDEGVAREVLAGGGPVLMADRGSETRWPRYRLALEHRQLSFGSALGCALESAGRRHGALVLYAAAPGHFDTETCRVANLLAGHAGLVLDAVAAADQNRHLQLALQSNRRIGMALGILIALHHCDDQSAFDRLREASQNLHVKLRDVAEEVILTGALPAYSARRSA